MRQAQWVWSPRAMSCLRLPDTSHAQKQQRRSSIKYVPQPNKTKSFLLSYQVVLTPIKIIYVPLRIPFLSLTHAVTNVRYLISDIIVVVVVVVFTLKTVLTSIQYLLFLTLQGKETNFRGHKLTQNKVQTDEVPTLAREILYRVLKVTSSEQTRSRLG